MRGRSRASGCVDDVRLLVEHDGDPVERGRRREERVVQLRQLLDRVEEVREVERECQQRADGHLALDHEPAADAEHDRGRDRREDVDGREVEPVQDHRLVVRLAVALVDAAEGRLARRLARERLHDAHAREILRERRRDEAEPLTDAAVGMVRARAEPGGREAHQRKDDQASRARAASRGGRARSPFRRGRACSGRGSRCRR